MAKRGQRQINEFFANTQDSIHEGIGSALGTTAGTAIGGLIGGPAGAAIGGSIGGVIGGSAVRTGLSKTSEQLWGTSRDPEDSNSKRQKLAGNAEGSEELGCDSSHKSTSSQSKERSGTSE